MCDLLYTRHTILARIGQSQPPRARGCETPRHPAGALDYPFIAGARATFNGPPEDSRGCQFKQEPCRMFVLTFRLSAANFVDVDLARPQACTQDGPAPPVGSVFLRDHLRQCVLRVYSPFVPPPTGSLFWRAKKNEQAVPEVMGCLPRTQQTQTEKNGGVLQSSHSPDPRLLSAFQELCTPKSPTVFVSS